MWACLCLVSCSVSLSRRTTSQKHVSGRVAFAAWTRLIGRGATALLDGFLLVGWHSEKDALGTTAVAETAARQGVQKQHTLWATVYEIELVEIRVACSS